MGRWFMGKVYLGYKKPGSGMMFLVGYPGKGGIVEQIKNVVPPEHFGFTGPAWKDELAISILADCVDRRTASDHFKEFRAAFMNNVHGGDGFRITEGEIRAWLQEIRRMEPEVKEETEEGRV